MGNWYLVRHGESEWNRAGRIQGHVDAPLSAVGRRQATLLAARLKDVRFDAIYSSDLDRAHETARHIAGDRNVAITTDPDLREFSYGEWEGLTLKQVEARYPGALAEQIAAGNLAFSAPGGESATQMLARVRRFCTRATKRHDSQENLMVVAHGGTLRTLLGCLLDLEDTDFWRFRVDCSGLAIVSGHSGDRVLERWNDTSHLAALNGTNLT